MYMDIYAKYVLIVSAIYGPATACIGVFPTARARGGWNKFKMGIFCPIILIHLNVSNKSTQRGRVFYLLKNNIAVRIPYSLPGFNGIIYIVGSILTVAIK